MNGLPSLEGLNGSARGAPSRYKPVSRFEEGKDSDEDDEDNGGRSALELSNFGNSG